MAALKNRSEFKDKIIANSSIMMRQVSNSNSLIFLSISKCPHVATFNNDIDQEALESTLICLNTSALPTLVFFQPGEKAAEVADVPEAITQTTDALMLSKESIIGQF